MRSCGYDVCALSSHHTHGSATGWHGLFNGYKDEVEYEWNRDAKAEQHEDLVGLIHCERGCG
jgi:hypothetical protein